MITQVSILHPARRHILEAPSQTTLCLDPLLFLRLRGTWHQIWHVMGRLHQVNTEHRLPVSSLHRRHARDLLPHLVLSQPIGQIMVEVSGANRLYFLTSRVVQFHWMQSGHRLSEV